MKIGLCQPYLFPYIGFYQLVGDVDIFVIYDDANYIKNRYSKGNTILSNGKLLNFSMPVIGASSFKKYNELEYQPNSKKLCKTIEYSYSKCEAFASFYPVVKKVLDSPSRKVSIVNAESISMVFDWAGMPPPKILYASDLEYDRSANASDKIIGIVKCLDGTEYVNPIGGTDLYDKEYFKEKGVDLRFLRSLPQQYAQIKIKEFQKNLSIIDLCMCIGKAGFSGKLHDYETFNGK